MRHVNRRLLALPSALAATVLLGGALVLAGASSASAHDVLESSERATRLAAAGYDEGARAFSPALNGDAVARLGSLGVGFLLSRTPFVNSRFVGGRPPPAVGLYRLEQATSLRFPSNRPPKGIKTGAALTGVALALIAGMLVSCKAKRAVG